MFNGDIETDIWKYFEQLHKNSTTHIKWNGLISEDFISEGKGNRQGGLASGDEWKIYNNEMIKQLEIQATDLDKISGISTACVAVADDVAPCATADTHVMCSTRCNSCSMWWRTMGHSST